MALFDNIYLVYIVLSIIYLIHIALIIANVAAEHSGKYIMGFQGNYVSLLISLLCLFLLSYSYYRNINSQPNTPVATSSVKYKDTKPIDNNSGTSTYRNFSNGSIDYE